MVHFFLKGKSSEQQKHQSGFHTSSTQIKMCFVSDYSSMNNFSIRDISQNGKQLFKKYYMQTYSLDL